MHGQSIEIGRCADYADFARTRRRFSENISAAGDVAESDLLGQKSSVWCQQCGERDEVERAVGTDDHPTACFGNSTVNRQPKLIIKLAQIVIQLGLSRRPPRQPPVAGDEGFQGNRGTKGHPYWITRRLKQNSSVTLFNLA